MKPFYFILLLFISPISIAQTLVINELDVDNPGIDEQEFVEIKSNEPNFSLDGYILVFFNGSNSGGDSSYLTFDLTGHTTDINGLLVIGSTNVSPVPQFIIAQNLIQNGADAVAIYQAPISDFPEGTVATQTNLIDALVYDTSDSDDTVLMGLLGVTEQINEGSGNNTNSIQRNNDGTYTATTPTPGVLNDGSGVIFNGIEITTSTSIVSEGESFDITFTTQNNVDGDYTFSFSLNNGNFNETDFIGEIEVTIPNGRNQIITTINLLDDGINEGDEQLSISFNTLTTPIIAYNDNIIIRVEDLNFEVANFGTPLNPTYGKVSSTQPENYYNSLNGLSGEDLETEIQNIISEENLVRAQTYADVIDILNEADQNPANSNEVWLVYSEIGRSKLDFQTTSESTGKWNREHTFPRSLAGYFSNDFDDIRDGKDVFTRTNADSLRHGNSDAHALRAADGPENSSRSNQHYGEYNGPEDTAGSFKGDVARSVLYLQLRYKALSVVNGFPDVDGQMGDLATLLDWHRNDPPDDFEMNRNNVIYTWQINRNPLIDLPDLVEYIWGNEIGNTWNASLSINEIDENDFIKIYPNPTTDKLFISGNKENYHLTILSQNGKEVFKTTTTKNNSFIDLKLASGLYILKIIAEENSFFKKIIIK